MAILNILSTIRVKLLLIAAAGTLLVLSAAGTGLYLEWRAIQLLATEVASLEADRARLSDARVAYSDQQREWKDSIIFGRLADSSEEHWAKFEENEQAVRRIMADVLAHTSAGALRDRIAEFQEQHAALGERSRKLRDLYMQYFDIDGTMSSARGMDVAPGESLASIVSELEKRIDGRRDEILASAPRAVITSVALMAAACAVAFIAFLLLLRAHVSRPLREMGEAVTAVANGDLTQPFQARYRDEIGTVITQVEAMRLRFTEMLERIRLATQSITTASVEITAGNQDLNTRTEHAASSLQQTAASMEEITGTVKQSAEAARDASRLASGAAEAAQRGGKVVSDVVTTMEAINGSSRKISDITGVIDGIAFQTNILALNAAVEAARAGEQGRGFAVVAAEVRTLAQRAAAAAKEIKGLIGDSVEKVDAGTRLVDQARVTMDEVVTGIQRLSSIVSEIAAAGREQQAGIEQVNQAIGEMDSVTQQNAAMVQEAAQAAQSLQEQACALQEAVSAFKVQGAGQGLYLTSQEPLRLT